MPQLTVQIWSDIACPWCYVGKRRFEAALAQFAQRAAVAVRWRAFELDPTAPRVRDSEQSYAERLAHKYDCSTAQAQQMIDAMVATAAGEGLAFRFDLIRPGNTFDAHRLVHLAAARGRGDAGKERLLRAYLCEGLAIGDPAVLLQLGVAIGLDRGEVRALLDGDAYADAVRGDEEQALRRRIRSVPYFLIGEHHGTAGAHPSEDLLQLLTTAWQERTAAPAPRDDGPDCGPAGCD